LKLPESKDSKEKKSERRQRSNDKAGSSRP